MTVSDVEVMLAESLDECQPLAEFAGESKLTRTTPHSQIDVRGGEIVVILYTAGDAGLVVIDYAPGMASHDTAFAGDIRDVHKALVRLTHHVDCEVIRDGFEPLTMGNRDV
ncbi:hypothetical protein [Halorubellus salinus]|uniref:hypothetical protein n=1 Tax=Halorubellus salinus TaxID=755309 RepID=UPI001D060855|nr:hypothetical protein [Halorubellus salinus]